MDLRRELLALLFLAITSLLSVNAQQATISLVAESVGVTEGETVRVCIEVDDRSLLDPSDSPSVRIETAEIETDDEEDITPLNMVVPLVAGTKSDDCFDIMTIDDNAVEPSESFEVFLAEENGVSVAVRRVTISISDNGDRVEIDLSDSALIGTEGSDVMICIAVTNGSNELADSVNVDIEISDITTDFSDYSNLANTINIPVGATLGSTYCTDIILIVDDVVEDEETFSVRLVSSAGATLVEFPNTTKTVTIMDGDSGTVSIDTLTVTEGNSGNTEFRVVIILESFIVSRAVQYTLRLEGGTATSGVDFLDLPPTTISFAPGSVGGSSDINIFIQIIGDEIGEPDETFDLVLTPLNPEGDTGLTVSLTIIDDEPKCEELGDPNDGVVMVSGLYQGAIATYECNPNYELQGTATRTCDTSAMWTNSEPSCTLIRCTEDPPALENGEVSFRTNVVGAMAVYTCDDGYEISTDTMRTCQSSRMWSNEEITCSQTSPRGGDDDDDDELSAGAIAGIVIAAIVIAVGLVVLIVLLVVCLLLRHRNRSGNFKPSYETQDYPSKIQKADIGEPVPADPETGTAETNLTQSNEMLVN